MRTAVHYVAAFLVLALYGGRVCPYLDSLTTLQLVAPLGVALLVQAMVRRPLAARLVEEAPDRAKVGRAFGLELGLFMAAGIAVAAFNAVAHAFPLASGAKVVLGFAVIGFFAATDLALAREHALARAVRDSGRAIDLGARPFPVSAKLALFAWVTTLFAVGVLFLIVAKDLEWLTTTAERTPLAALRLSFLKEVAFVAAVTLGYVTVILRSHARNLRFFLEHETRVLERAAQDDLDGMVPVASNDEFGRIARDTNRMVASLRARRHEVQVTQDVAILALATLAETRDNETGGHILRTQNYVRALAEHLRHHPRFRDSLSDEDIDLLHKSAPLHDIGKVGIPDRILLKPGKLTEDEWAIMKTHPDIGREALRVAEEQFGSTSFLRHARDIAGTHHEKWDGSGYPRGLAGDAIPVSGRLMALADVYDALISKRVYKPAFSHEKARAIIVEGRGGHFDPDVVDAFLAIEDTFQAIARAHADEPESAEGLTAGAD